MRSEQELPEGASHVFYEMAMLASVAHRLCREDLDEVERNAYVESELVHARNLIAFLLTRVPREGDIWPGDFANGWDADAALGNDRTKELAATRDYINKHLAHLTWSRLKEFKGPETYVGGVFDAMVRFVLHLEAENAPTAEMFRANYMQALGYFTAPH